MECRLRRRKPRLFVKQCVIPLLIISAVGSQGWTKTSLQRRWVGLNSRASTLALASSRPKNDREDASSTSGKDPSDTSSSLSKDLAISALSQPQQKAAGRQQRRQGTSGERNPYRKASRNQKEGGRFNTSFRDTNSEAPESYKSRRSSKSKPLPNNMQRKNGTNVRRGNEYSTQSRRHRTDRTDAYSSLLPPLSESMESMSEAEDDADDPLSSGLSSWEEFLGGGAYADDDDDESNENTFLPTPSPRRFPKPAITPKRITDQNDRKSISTSTSQQQQLLPSIQDLFPPDISSATATPSSSASLSSQQENPTRNQPTPSLDGVLPVSDLFYRQSQQDEEEHDDEELPFSQEQSDAVSSENNKIRVRRNLAAESSTIQSNNSLSSRLQQKKQSPSHKMVRRGMEMLVGGVPINADPPQRSLELHYDITAEDWASVVSLNTRDFGPLLYTLKQMEQRGIFCERFCYYTSKWDICPHDLSEMVRAHESKRQGIDAVSSQPPKAMGTSQVPMKGLKSGMDTLEVTNASQQKQVSTNETNTDANVSSSTSDEEFFGTKGEFSFEIGVTIEELQAGGGDVFKSVFERGFKTVLERAVDSVTKSDKEDFNVKVVTLSLKEMDDGYTRVNVEFKVDAEFATSYDDMEIRFKRIGALFTEAMERGDIALALAAAAKEEERWPQSLRERVVEECLFQDDDLGDRPTYPVENQTGSYDSCAFDVTDEEEEEVNVLTSNDEYYVGGGSNSDVALDYSVSDILSSPYNGEIGLRLVDAVVERAKQRLPRVIAIGDVHGCIDELQDLLRQCDYRPGDLVVFLGDLVCKGPDSISVVQMAREIGAIGVRGNHDFEVIRWHQAIKSGVDPPVVGSEHFHIASCLTKADMKWMYSLPWYISSKSLGSLFVHAGFVSGIRLAKQNPRLMMNMRSILPDGTVTSKFFNNWPWARLWDGPQTVLFGHDADRGLQQYEHAIGLDTGCVYGGRLTACILPEKRLVSVSARREYFKYRRKHYD